MNTGIPRNQNDGIYDTYGDAQGDKLSLREGHVIYVRSASLYAEVVTEVTPYPITGSNPALYIQPQNTTPGTGETNTGSNIGLGEDTFAQKSGTDLQFYSQVSQYGLESHLVGNTYYRGLNPFVADKIGAFVEDMETSRTTTATVINRSGVIEGVPVDSPAYGKNGLSCYRSYTCDFSHSGNLTTGAGWTAGGSTLSLDSLYDVGKITGSKVTPTTDLGVHNGPNKAHVPAVGTNTLTYLIHPNELGIVQFGSNISWSPASGNQLCRVDFRSGTILSGSSLVTRLEKLAEGWWLFTHKFEVESSVSGVPILQIYSNDNKQMWANNGTDSLYFGLVQNSSGALNPPLLFTGSTSETRAADTSTLTVSGNLPAQGNSFCFVVDTNMFYSDDFGPTLLVSNSNLVLSKSDLGKNYAAIKTTDGMFYAGISNDADDEVVRFAVKYDSGSLKLFKNGSLIQSTVTTGTPIYSYSDLIFLGVNESGSASINTEIKIKKWFVNEVPTDDQIQAWGGPDNVIL